MDFKAYLSDRQQRVNEFLTNWLPPSKQDPQYLHQSMNYAVLNGGKRIRPILVYATGESFGAKLEKLDRAACAVELIHAYSLVHDDLPCMDDDDLRRGKPSCHKAFNEATAILTGDALQTLAFHILSHCEENQIPSLVALKMITELAKAAGSSGMVGGQSLDLDAEGQIISLEQLHQIHHLKTGALICASIKLGAIAAEVEDESVMEKLTQYAKNIGLCFQIKDDILDIEENTDTLGKQQGSDQAHSKATFPAINGLDNAKKSLNEYYQKAISLLDELQIDTSRLRNMADYIVKRHY